MNADATLVRLFKCALALIVVFGGWYIADPQLATFQGADPHNLHALSNPPLYRLVVYTTYVMSIVVTWICTTPLGRTRSPNPPACHEER